MLLQVIDNLANKQIIDAISQGFWTKIDFYIFIILAFGGIYISWKGLNYSKDAFKEAGQAKDAATAAKDAANKAGKTVKKQSMLLAISETTRIIGQLRHNTSHEDAYGKLMEINGKIRNIIGFYREDLGQSQQGLLQQIETCISELLIAFNLLDSDSLPKLVHDKIRPNITLLSGHLNELQGVLENELISNN